MLAYAETHYPRIGPSRIRRREPEIVADLPWRVEPGAPIPALIVVKDAHWYPTRVHSLAFVITDAEGGGEAVSTELTLDEKVKCRWWWRLVELPPLPSGSYEVTVTIRYTCGGENRAVESDNYRGTSHRPFAVTVGNEPWPIPAGWLAGDVHTHTEFTRDQVEFGPPVPAISAMSRAMGLGWVALTDHSYDLDDSEESFLVNDPALPRWRGLLAACREAEAGVCLIPGEEVSCGNRKGRNVHLLALGIERHIPGKGDSAERPLHTHPDLSVPEVVERIRAQGGIALAAHSGNRPFIGERIIFRRGGWEPDDLAEPGLAGAQFWNGVRDGGFRRGMRGWVRQLLSGKRAVALAGNDAHGAFGRSRRVRIPWISLAEDTRHLFGRVRTVVCARNNRDAVLSALGDGKCYLTDGPALTAEIETPAGRFPAGGDVAGEAQRFHVHAVSTSDWGTVEKVGVACGVLGERAERWSWYPGPEGRYRFDVAEALPPEKPAYIRAEVHTRDGAFAMTNPIWLNGGG